MGSKITEFACRACNKPFFYKASYLTAHRKKFGKDPAYCSMPCSNLGRRKNATARHEFTCDQCGKPHYKRRKPGGRIYEQQRFCCNECKSTYQREKAFARFKRGEIPRHIKKHGYVWIGIPSLVTGKKHEMLEHRYVMSQHLGRPLLKEETVHHKDGNRQNNELRNLELFNSRHGPGQRVTDKIAFAIEMLQRYPEFARAAGYELRAIDHVTASAPERPEECHAPSCP